MRLLHRLAEIVHRLLTQGKEIKQYGYFHVRPPQFTNLLSNNAMMIVEIVVTRPGNMKL